MSEKLLKKNETNLILINKLMEFINININNKLKAGKGTKISEKQHLIFFHNFHE